MSLPVCENPTFNLTTAINEARDIVCNVVCFYNAPTSRSRQMNHRATSLRENINIIFSYPYIMLNCGAAGTSHPDGVGSSRL